MIAAALQVFHISIWKDVKSLLASIPSQQPSNKSVVNFFPVRKNCSNPSEVTFCYIWAIVFVKDYFRVTKIKMSSIFCLWLSITADSLLYEPNLYHSVKRFTWIIIFPLNVWRYTWERQIQTALEAFLLADCTERRWWVWVCTTGESTDPAAGLWRSPLSWHPPSSISFVSSLCRSSLPSLITHSSIIGQVPHYGNIFSSDFYLHGVPELVGIVGGRWVHEAHHDFLEVIGKLLLQVTNQVLWREKQIPSLYRLPILWEKWDNGRKSSSTISFSTSLHIITSLVLVHTCVRGLHDIVDLRVWKWLMRWHLCMKHHLYGYSSHVNTEGYSFPNPNPTPLLISLWK